MPTNTIPTGTNHSMQHTDTNVPADAPLHDLYGLTQEEFAQLLADTEATGNCASLSNTLAGLQKHINDTGSEVIRTNCIELLHNIALRNDIYGYQAEKILVDLFTQPDNSAVNITISEQIAAASLQLVTRKEKLDATYLFSGAARLKKTSALLYMAGSHPTASMEIKEEIIKTINTPESTETAAGLWNKGRFITHEELYESGKKMEAKYENISVNAPMEFTYPKAQGNKLTEILREKYRQNPLAKLKQVAELFTINTVVTQENEQSESVRTKEHWTLAALYREPLTGAIKMAVFSSLRLDTDDKTRFTDSIEDLSGSRENITFIDDNLQDYTPNACGCFTDSAAEYIGQRYQQNKDIAGILREFAADMKRRSQESLEQFNISSRSRLLAETYLNHNKP